MKRQDRVGYTAYMEALVKGTYQDLRKNLGIRQALRETARLTGYGYEDVCRTLGFSSDWLQPGRE